MYSPATSAKPLSTAYCRTMVGANYTAMFYVAGPLSWRKFSIFPDKIVIGRGLFGQAFQLDKTDIDTIQLFRNVLFSFEVPSIKIIHHNKAIPSPIVVEQYTENLAALQQADYPVQGIPSHKFFPDR